MIRPNGALRFVERERERVGPGVVNSHHTKRPPPTAESLATVRKVKARDPQEAHVGFEVAFGWAAIGRAGRGACDTDRADPDGPLARPDEVASATLFLLTDDASLITGAELCVDSGMRQV
jgi:NAD(P)-dependent dehydrogenase (short-subunit alcohol dehydrogenase family)